MTFAQYRRGSQCAWDASCTKYVPLQAGEWALKASSLLDRIRRNSDQNLLKTLSDFEVSPFIPSFSYFRPVAIFLLVSRTATAGSEDRFFFR
jgi:hypothetical protein